MGSKYHEAPHLSVGHEWRGRRGHNDYSEARLVRYRERLDLLNIVDFKWMPYNTAAIIFVVPPEFRGAPHGDFYTFAVLLIFFRFIEVLSIDRVLRHFGGKQCPSRPPLNIDIFHKQSARNDDGWWPTWLREWSVVWNNSRTAERRTMIDPAIILYPTRQYFDWYKERTSRFANRRVF
ncbi:hypothetical protein PIB30_002573 [Stylosanthes scabra]|uniref:Aminotransferase-like plant mobile domain-containing protein n=1 Tax=Stylosanthes scabra TaxID=79078 RepID=A0ABU6Z068_9FABA|nr:hypothetical protein [Stylosanthes scabra]